MARERGYSTGVMLCVHVSEYNRQWRKIKSSLKACPKDAQYGRKELGVEAGEGCLLEGGILGNISYYHAINVNTMYVKKYTCFLK